ncbi:MAG: hypothetical protein IRZ19_11640, partial [Pyrinomonas methylaliphatogenes]|nr:hypothetical protein [Pyrinomonas methylaliphatogenes]
MFDVLVESGSHKEDLQRKGSFLLGTAIIYGLLILGFFVLSIYLYEA